MKYLIKFLCCWIPQKKWRKRARLKLYECFCTILGSLMPLKWKFEWVGNNDYRIVFSVSDYKKIQDGYSKVLIKLNEKAKNNKKINVGFVINIAQVFPARTVFENMMKDSFFNPFIIVVPFAMPAYEYKRMADIAFESLSQQYPGYVYKGYDDLYNAIDSSREMDIAVLPSNDEHVEPVYYKIYNFIKHRVLTLYCPYAWHICNDTSAFVNDTVNFLWKYVAENKTNLQQIKDVSLVKGRNAVLVGCAKVDKMYGVKRDDEKRKKRIVIAPHHSINEVGLCSRFLVYANLFLQLPKMYPDITFIFRPHPCLIPNLEQPSVWGIEKTSIYLNDMKKNENVVFDDSPEYFDTFVNSDGIIHDCGSFIPEYLLTRNPCCYLLKDGETVLKYFNSFGQKCLEHYYQAFCEKDILQFIDDVIIGGNDVMKTERINFVNAELKVNYPNVGKKIVECIKSEIYLQKGKTND